MDTLLSGRDTEDKKKKKSRKDKKAIPHTDLTPFPLDSNSPPWSALGTTSSAFSPVSTMNGPSEMVSPAPSGLVAPKAPWLSGEASNDGTSSIFSENSSSTVGPSSITVRGRTDPRDIGYDTDAPTNDRSKSRGKLRKRSKSRPRKGAGDAGYETDDGYVSSTPASEKTLNKSKSRSRFFKLGNRSKSHVPSDDEHEAPPPVPVVPPPQPQFRLPIAARFATTLGDLNKGATIEPPLGDYPGLPGAKKEEEKSMVTTTSNRNLEVSKTDSVDFSTAMSRVFAAQQESPTKESPAKQRSEPVVHFRTPIPPINTAPSSYQPNNTFSGTSTRDSAASGTSSEQHTSSSSSAAHSSTSHATASTTATSITSYSPPSTATSSGSGLFSRFGSRRTPSAAKEAENHKALISYPITRSPPPESASSSSGSAPPSSFTSTSSPPASGRTTPTDRKTQRPMFLHRTPSSDRIGGKSSPAEGPGREVFSSTGYQSVRPAPSNLVIPTNVNNFSRSPSPVPSSGLSSPSPIPSTTYIVPSPSEFSRPSPRIRPPTSEEQFQFRTRVSEENLRSRTRASEDTFIPPPSVFTIPPATPPPTSPLPDVPPTQTQGSQSVFATQQKVAMNSHPTPRYAPPAPLTAPAPATSYLRAPSPSPGLRPSSPNSPMRGRESPFPAKPKMSPIPPKADLDGFGGRVKVRRYAELYGFQGKNLGDEEDDTIPTASGRLPVRRDDDDEWTATRNRQREERERERAREKRGGGGGGGGGTNLLQASLHFPSRSRGPRESNGWKKHRPRQSTQVGIEVEEPSDPEEEYGNDYREDEGYGGEEAFGGGGSIDSHSGYVDDEDDAARYYRGRIGFSEEERQHVTSPAIGRKHSYEALEKRSKVPNKVGSVISRTRRSEEDYSESETGHSSVQSHITGRSKGKSEEDHYYGAASRRFALSSPAASEDSHYSVNGRFTMYEDDDDYNLRSTMYSEAGSFVDESKSRKIRDRFVHRVEGMYDSTGREKIPPVPAIPSSTYLSASGRSSPNPLYEGLDRGQSQNQNHRLAGIASGKGTGGSSPIPPVPKLPKGAMVGIVGEDGEVVSSKVWI